jgi:hypothetical protein
VRDFAAGACGIGANFRIEQDSICVPATYNLMFSVKRKCATHTETSEHRMRIGRREGSRSEICPYFPEAETFSEYRGEALNESGENQMAK